MTDELDYTVCGPKNCPILFFIHGWPDTAELWSKQVDFFSDRFRCVCVTLPGFLREEVSTDFSELVERIAKTIQKINPNSTHPVIVIAHDWGAYLAYFLDQKHQNLVSKLVTLDVGAHVNPNIKETLFMVGYQWWLAAAFLIAKIYKPVGDRLARAMARWLRAPNPEKVYARMGYLYFYFWRARLLKRYRQNMLRRYTPSVPLLYIYGAKKPIQFQSKRWENMLIAKEDCDCVVIENGGHWFLLKFSDHVNSLILDWINR